MPFPGPTYLTELSTPELSPVYKESLAFSAVNTQFLSAQHKSDGSHSDVTADSLDVSGTSTLNGPTKASDISVDKITLTNPSATTGLFGDVNFWSTAGVVTAVAVHNDGGFEVDHNAIIGGDLFLFGALSATALPTSPVTAGQLWVDTTGGLNIVKRA